MKYLLFIVFLFVFAFSVFGQSTCNYAVFLDGVQAPTASSLSVFSQGQTGSIKVVSTGTGCLPSSSASVNPDWILSGVTISDGSYKVLANATNQPRDGIFIVRTPNLTYIFHVYQEANTCPVSLPAQAVTIDAAGGVQSVPVTTDSSCKWRTILYSSWLKLEPTSTGLGNGMVAFSVPANLTGGTRTSTIIVNGSTYTVNQSAGAKSRKRTRFF